jgi:hypothetical protein
MKDWKLLPAYKAEPRIDSLIGYYLIDILSEFCGDRMVGIVPELPIRLATVNPKYKGTNSAYRSYKVDFYLLSAFGNNYLVELKTDSGSRRDKQDLYLKNAQDKGMREIIEGIKKIASVSTYKKKYNHLLSKLTDLGLLNDKGQYSGKSEKIEIIYVLPNNTRNSSDVVINFEWISKWLRKTYANEEFEQSLSDALECWAKD